MSDFIAGHEIAIQDTGAPRGERNYWRVLLNGQSVYEGHNGAQAQRIYRAVSEGLKRATQPAAGDPVYQWFDGKDWKDCASRRDCFHIQASGFPIREVKSAPPAAAHGDEMDRDEVQMQCLRDLYESGYNDGQNNPNGYSSISEREDAAQHTLRDMRAQAGEGGD